MSEEKSQGRLGRAWDSFDVYLFDIDGTLLECTDATHYFAFCDALKRVSGRELTLEGVTAHGNTDVGILRDALTLAAIAESDWRPRLAEMLDGMCAFVEAHGSDLCTTVLPRVEQVLEHLRACGAKRGVATGNLERIGKLKLKHAGLLQCFDFGGWSDAYETRSEVFRAAVEEARQRYGKSVDLCVIGDTPSDVRAAHDNALAMIAVATGVYSFEQLEQEQPELCIASFEKLFNAG